jgi:uncharacterized protein YidB (DUF937 family)
MGIFDEVGKALGGTQGGQAAGGGQLALMQALAGLLAGGGLAGLVDSFKQKGLGDIVGSWVSTGPNLPVSPAQITHALGPDQLGQIAKQAGIDPGVVSGQLAKMLPGVVDQLTPSGRLPGVNDLQAGLGGLLKGLF